MILFKTPRQIEKEACRTKSRRLYMLSSFLFAGLWPDKFYTTDIPKFVQWEAKEKLKEFQARMEASLKASYQRMEDMLAESQRQLESGITERHRRMKEQIETSQERMRRIKKSAGL